MDKAARAIRRLWGELEVVDAEKDLRVFIRPSDVKDARTKDPGHCVFAKACQRQFDATKVMFFKSVAYVDLPGVDGVRRVERFQMSPDMRKLVESFDRGKPFRDVAGFELRKPRPSYTLEALNERDKRRIRPARRVKPGNVPPKRSRRMKPLRVDLSVRSGVGQVKFKKAR